MMNKLKTLFDDFSKHNSIAWLVIVAVTFLIYSNTLKFDIQYNFDDDAYINDTSINTLNSSNVRGYFTTYYLGMYQPVPVLSFAALLHVFPGSVEAQRLSNLLLHSLNILLVLLLVGKLTRNKTIGCMSALIFAIHPMNVESITWISARGNLLYSFFYLLTLLLYYSWRSDSRSRNLWLMFISFVLALFCKVTAATLPVLIILFDVFYRKELVKKSILIYAPMLVLSGVFIWIGVNASGSFGHITELKESYSVIDRIFLILQALWIYLTKLIVPYGQSAIYLYPWKTGGNLPVFYYTTGMIILVLLGVIFNLGWIKREKFWARALAIGFLFFIAAISIVLPLKWSRTILVAERYTYLPYLAIIVSVVWIAHHYFVHQSLVVKRIMLSLLFLFLMYFGYSTYQRNEVWKTPVSLFSDVIRKSRSDADVAAGYYNRGNDYMRTGNAEEALSDYSNAIRLNPGYVEAYYNKGLIYLYISNFQEAVNNLSESIKIDNRNPDAFINRGIAFRSLGEYEQALKDFNSAISTNASSIAYFNRGALYYFNLEDPAHACNDWKQALNMGYLPAGEVLEKFCR